MTISDEKIIKPDYLIVHEAWKAYVKAYKESEESKEYIKENSIRDN